MSDPAMIKEIKAAVTIPVMAKVSQKLRGEGCKEGRSDRHIWL
jgi:hypothetical protein